MKNLDKETKTVRQYLGAVIVDADKYQGKLIYGAAIDTGNGTILYLVESNDDCVNSVSYYRRFKDNRTDYIVILDYTVSPDQSFREYDSDYINKVYFRGCPLREKFLRGEISS